MMSLDLLINSNLTLFSLGFRFALIGVYDGLIGDDDNHSSVSRFHFRCFDSSMTGPFQCDFVVHHLMYTTTTTTKLTFETLSYKSINGCTTLCKSIFGNTINSFSVLMYPFKLKPFLRCDDGVLGRESPIRSTVVRTSKCSILVVELLFVCDVNNDDGCYCCLSRRMVKRLM